MLIASRLLLLLDVVESPRTNSYLDSKPVLTLYVIRVLIMVSVLLIKVKPDSAVDNKITTCCEKPVLL